MKKESYKKSLESNADFKSTCCENILSNLYSLMNNIYHCPFPESESVPPVFPPIDKVYIN